MLYAGVFYVGTGAVFIGTGAVKKVCEKGLPPVNENAWWHWFSLLASKGE